VWKTASALISIVLVLLALGIVMVGSASGVKGGSEDFGDPYFFLKRQCVWLLLGTCAGIAVACFDYRRLKSRPVSGALLALAIVLLLLVFVPGAGRKAGGANRWIRLGRLGMQPSEFAKIAVILFIAAEMSRARFKANRFKEGLLVPLLPLGVVTGLIFLEPDYGTAFLTAAGGMIMLFVGGTRLLYLFLVSVAGLCAFLLAIMQNPLRMRRVMAFLFPEKYPAVAYHLQRSEYAFIMGNAFGVGLNKSMEKHFYLPEAHTDFIYAIVGEELGILGTLAVLIAFAGVLACGVRISLGASDTFGRLFGFGLTTMLALQAVINIAVVTGCLPTKGLALPFISYGGSSLFMSMVCVAILVSIARRA
jgi:cell division protein FtsW